MVSNVPSSSFYWDSIDPVTTKTVVVDARKRERFERKELSVKNGGVKKRSRVSIIQNSRPISKVPYSRQLSVAESCTRSCPLPVTQPPLAVKPRRVVALDCEMVGVAPKDRSALARCSIVDCRGQIVYDRYIRPKGEIVNFRTKYSGIRPYHMVGAVPMHSALSEIHTILKNTIIVGHDLAGDFSALQYKHPQQFIYDTSNCKRLRLMSDLPVNQKASLKKLSYFLLNRSIQVGRRGHDSVEDARATMDLYLLSKRSEGDCNFLSDSYWEGQRHIKY